MLTEDRAAEGREIREIGIAAAVGVEPGCKGVAGGDVVEDMFAVEERREYYTWRSNWS